MATNAPVPISRARGKKAAKAKAEPVLLTVMLHFTVDGARVVSAPITLQLAAPEPGQQAMLELSLDARKLVDNLAPHIGPSSGAKPAPAKLWTPGR